MAVIECNEIWLGRGGDDDVTTQRNDVRVFRVLTDSNYDDATIIKAAGVLPERRDPHPRDPGILVKSRSFKQDPAIATLWIATVTYSSVLDIASPFSQSGGSGGSGGGGGGNPEQANPIFRAPEFSFSTEQFKKELDRAFPSAPGNPAPDMTNTAGDYFFPPISVPAGELVMTYTVNKASYDPVVYWDLLGSVNKVEHLNYFDPQTLLFYDHSATSAFETIPYWKLTHKFRINFDFWNPTNIVDKGFRRLNMTTGKLEEITDGRGNKITRPADLNGAGDTLGFGDPKYNIPFYLYEAKDFGPLR